MFFFFFRGAGGYKSHLFAEERLFSCTAYAINVDQEMTRVCCVGNHFFLLLKLCFSTQAGSQDEFIKQRSSLFVLFGGEFRSFTCRTLWFKPFLFVTVNRKRKY